MTEASADMVMARYCRKRAAGQTESQSKRKRPGLEKPSHSIEDPLPFKNFDEGALHLKRFASRCTNGAGGRSLEMKSCLPAGDGDEACGCRATAIEGTLFLLSNEALDWNKPGVLVRLQGWVIVARSARPAS
jgi:hypothetical protein